MNPGRLRLIPVLFLVFGFAATRLAGQSADAFFGVSTAISAPISLTATSSLGGGYFPSVGVTVWPTSRFGFANLVEGRIGGIHDQSVLDPILWSPDLAWRAWRTTGRMVELDVEAGPTVEWSRFAVPVAMVTGTGASTPSSGPARFGGNVAFSVTVRNAAGFFVRPEVRFYAIRDNTQFSSDYALSFSIFVGYSFGK